MKKNVKNIWKCGIIIIIFIVSKISFTYAINAHNLQAFNNYCDSGMIKSGTNTSEESNADTNLILTFDENALMFRKNGIMKIGEYNNKEIEDPYEVSGPGELAKDCIYGDRIYKVIGKRGEIDDSYKNQDWFDANEKMRRKFELELDALMIGYRGEAARGFGKYNLRVEKNLVPFLKYVDRFYKSVDYRYGKTQEQIDSSGHFEPGTKVCEELEALKNYHSKSSINNKINDFKSLFKKCNSYEPVLSNGSYISEKSGETTFETLQDMFMALVYLKPALKELKTYYSLEFNGKNINELTDTDRAAIISMAYDKFSDRVLANGGDEENDDNLTITMKIGDIYYPLIKYEKLSVAERIYHYMIEIKYANNPDAQSRWVAEAEKVLGTFAPLDYEEYEKFYKAYQEAQKKYEKHKSPATAYDYNGEVLHPEDFESTHKFDASRNTLATYLRTKFSNSSFFTTANNADIAARNYMIVSKMVEDQAFSDITEIYCSDVELVTHSYGYESTEIMLADFTRAELNDAWGTDTDTDNDGLNDNVEAYGEEELDIRSFVEDYCRYNNITGEELQRYLTMYGKTKVYNFKSSPVLPDTDFDGRNDRRDQGHPLDNKYTIKTTSNNYNITVDFNMDYRYFFMKSSDYYAELSKMSAMLANAILKGNKSFTVTTDGNYTNSGIQGYMYWLGMDTGTFIGEDNDVPYAMNCHDVVYKDKVKNVIAIVVGEKYEYKDTLASNYNDENYEHSGFVEKAEYIYDKFIDYDSTKSGDKVYWIVGYGTGGSVANIIADRIVSAKGTESVYCYTFGAIDTIDREKIPEGEVIENEKNESIFNLKNIDDLSLLTLGNAWTSYGRDVTFSLADDETVKREFKEIVKGVKYNMTKKNMKSNVSIFKRLLDDLMEFMSNIFNWKGRIETRKIEENNKLASDIGAYIASTYKDIVEGYISAESYFGNDEYYEEDGMVSGFAGTQNISESPANVKNKVNIKQFRVSVNGLDPKDGYKFLDDEGNPLDYTRFNNDVITDNSDNIPTVKVKIGKNYSNLIYSNYTMKDEPVFCDIDFTKFWNISESESEMIKNYKAKYPEDKKEAAHMHLFDIAAGDFGKEYNVKDAGKTLTTTGGYLNTEVDYIFKNKLGIIEGSTLEQAIIQSDGVIESKALKNEAVGDLIMIDGRIVAAFPYVAHVDENSEDYKDIGKIMHKYDNYYHPEDNKQGRFNSWGNKGGESRKFSYVDVVFEKDGNKKHQYVVPFMIVSVKDLHYQPKKEGFYAAFVDNRFGQVYQTKSNKAYPSRIVKREVDKLSPIEPFIRLKKDINKNVVVRDSILLTPKDRIVSMRVYEHKFDVNDKRHFLNIRGDESKIQLDNDSIKGPILSEDNNSIANTIIKYHQIDIEEQNHDN